jgi:hypothetical protein
VRIHAGSSHALAGQRMLLARNGGGGDMATVVLRCIQREAAPTGADLDHPVGRLQVEFAADAFQLAFGRDFQRVGWIGPDCRGIHQVR